MQVRVAALSSAGRKSDYLMGHTMKHNRQCHHHNHRYRLIEGVQYISLCDMTFVARQWDMIIDLSLSSRVHCLLLRYIQALIRLDTRHTPVSTWTVMVESSFPSTACSLLLPYGRTRRSLVLCFIF